MTELYQFKREDALRFAQEQNAKTKIRGNELQFHECPYCHNPKDTYTFSINLETGQFKCLRASCGAHGNMITLHRDFGFDLGNDMREYEKPSYSWRHFKTPEKPIEPDEPAIKYLTGRGISLDVIKKYQIKSVSGNDNRIAFPFFDQGGELQFIKYRYIDPSKTKDGRKEDCERNCKAILFGMMQCVPDEPLVITEGQIDSLSVATAGIPNAVSVPTGKNGMTWIPHCWDWMQQWKTIIVFGDYEHGSMTLLPDIRSRFDCEIRAVRPESYRGCKDANELLQKFGVDAVREAVNTAQPEIPAEIKRMSDIKYDDDNDERLPVGIKEIDDILGGGLPFGYLSIVTGKRGEGKSTFGSMINKSALEHGYTTFTYSGEMRTGDVRKWLDSQIAGPERITAENVGGYIRYTISEPISRDIANWYKDKAYIYDTGYISESPSNLLELIETSIKQMGCRFILIDNLMTAIDIIPSGEPDKYEKQSLICKSLARMAQNYNVIIVLVAHKKKGGGWDENDDVLGSSEITNLAGVVMSYGRSDKVNADQRVIRISKNRLNGKLTSGDGIVVGFEEASKRIYGISDDDVGPREESVCFSNADGFSDEYGDIPF